MAADLTQVKELATAYGQDNANRYLKAGWILLRIDHASGGVFFGHEYTVGWCQEGPPANPHGVSNPFAELAAAATPF